MMQSKGRRISESVCLFITVAFIAVVLFGVSDAFAVECKLGNTTLDITGFIRQEAAVGTAGDTANRKTKWKLVSAYSSLWIEPDWTITPNLNFHGVLYFLGDQAYTFNDHEHFWAPFQNSENNMRWDVGKGEHTIRECTLGYMGENFSVMLGKQQIIWGRSDALRLADQVNPLDLRREWILRDSDKGYEESRIPLWAAKVEGYAPSSMLPSFMQDLTLEFDVIPGDIEATRQTLGWEDGGVWSVPLEVLYPINAQGVGVQLREDLPSSKLSNSEFGMRLKSTIGPFYVTLFGFYGYQDDFVLKPTGFSLGGYGYNVFGGQSLFPVNFKFDKYYARKKDVGMTFNCELYGVRKLVHTRVNPVLRGEFLYEFDKPFNTTDWGLYDQQQLQMAMGVPIPNPVGPESAIKRRDQFRGMLGLDWPIKIDWLNRYKSFWFSLQVFYYLTEGDCTNLQNAPFPWPVHKQQGYTSLVCTTEYCNGTVKPAFAGALDLNERAGFMKAYVDFEIGDHWRPSIGVMNVWKGNQGAKYGYPDAESFRSFGIFHQTDQIFASVKYQF